jgi:hypothetical protein
MSGFFEGLPIEVAVNYTEQHCRQTTDGSNPSWGGDAEEYAASLCCPRRLFPPPKPRTLPDQSNYI